jgi:hypothetical protein
MPQHRTRVRTLVEQRRYEARTLWGSLRTCGSDRATGLDPFWTVSWIRYVTTAWRTEITRRERADERDKYR